MERIPGRIYAQEFRDKAVKLVQAEGLSMWEAARRLSMPVGSLKNWLQAARAWKRKEAGKTQKPLSDLELELVRHGPLLAHRRPPADRPNER